MVTLEENTIKAIVAMACVTALTMYSLYLGIDGALFAAVIAALAGLGGFELAKRLGD